MIIMMFYVRRRDTEVNTDACYGYAQESIRYLSLGWQGNVRCLQVL